jgi:hypothetical protein
MGVLIPRITLDNLTTRVNAEINKIAVWFKANKMATINGKTKHIFPHKKILLDNLNFF